MRAQTKKFHKLAKDIKQNKNWLVLVIKQQTQAKNWKCY